MILSEKYFPTNSFLCKIAIAVISANKKFVKNYLKQILRRIHRTLEILIGYDYRLIKPIEGLSLNYRLVYNIS